MSTSSKDSTKQSPMRVSESNVTHEGSSRYPAVAFGVRIPLKPTRKGGDRSNEVNNWWSGLLHYGLLIVKEDTLTGM
jgi:hypothetical protein